MTKGISVIIPAHNEEKYITRCLQSIRLAQQQISTPVEIIVVLNRCTDRTEAIARGYEARTIIENARNLARIRNTGVKASSGDIIVTIDADSWMSENMLREVYRRLKTGRYVGGGVRIKAERLSIGIFFSIMTFAPKLLLKRIWAGMFWTFRKNFDAVGGFNEDLVSVEDVDFAKRMRAYGQSKNLRYGLILRAYIMTSCRKFDRFGDWFLFRNPNFMKRIFTGRDIEAANRLYYDDHPGEGSH